MDSRIDVTLNRFGEAEVTATTIHGEGRVRVARDGLTLVGVFAENPIRPAVASLLTEAMSLAVEAWQANYLR